MGQLTDGLNALIRYSNEVTGASDGTISDAVHTLCDGYGQGGGGVVDEMADVLFIDYDGTLIAGYTLEEAHALTALPTPPAHEGLTFQEWNCTLAEVNALTYRQVVGANYIPTDGKLHIFVDLPYDGIEINTNVIVRTDWGDGTIEDNYKHTYARGGKYEIKLTLGANTNLYQFSGMNSLANYATEIWLCNVGTFQAYNVNAPIKLAISNQLHTISTDCFQNWNRLLALVIPRGCNIGQRVVSGGNALRYISCPCTMTDTTGVGHFSGCVSLIRLTYTGLYFNAQDAYHSTSLQELIVPNSTKFGDSCISGSSSLRLVELGSSVATLENYSFYGCGTRYCIISRALTPPSAQSGTFTDKPIRAFVPDDSVDAYKTAWSAISDRIFPISTYRL